MDFKFPDVGEGITEGVIVKWFVKEGDTVNQDDVLCEVETDKAVVEIPSPEVGIIKTIYHKEGDTVTVGESLVKYDKEEKAYDEKKDQGGVVGNIIDIDNLSDDNDQGPLFDKLKNKGGFISTRIKILPALRKLALELGVDITKIRPVSGAITKKDIEMAAKGAHGPDKYGEIEYEKLSGIRRSTINHLKKSSDMIPVSQTHFGDITKLSLYRKEINKSWEQKGYHFTFMPFICMALIGACKTYPRFNSEWSDAMDELIIKKYINIGIAVDTNNGLYVPVIKKAHLMGIKDISREINSLVIRVKDKTIDSIDLTGASITITNYGSAGTVFANPMINYPNTCILGVGAIQKVLKMVGTEVKEVSMLPLTLTYDHRFNDGADAARFLNQITKFLEDEKMFRLS